MTEPADPRRFATLVVADPVPLGEAALVAASFLGHSATVEHGMEQLAALADAVDGDDLTSVARHLFVTVGLRGDRANYYDPANSLLPAVLERRRGIPITLAIVAADVARRRGIEANIVGMPGHVLVGDGDPPSRWFDGFDGGRVLDAEGAQAMFEHLHGPRVPFDHRYLSAMSDPFALARMLANFIGICTTNGDAHRLLRAYQLRAVIPGIGQRERAALADALTAVGRYVEAAEVWAEERDRPVGSRSGEAQAAIDRLRANLN